MLNLDLVNSRPISVKNRMNQKMEVTEGISASEVELKFRNTVVLKILFQPLEEFESKYFVS